MPGFFVAWIVKDSYYKNDFRYILAYSMVQYIFHHENLSCHILLYADLGLYFSTKLFSEIVFPFFDFTSTGTTSPDFSYNTNF